MPGRYFSRLMAVSCRKTCRERSFWARGWPATLAKRKENDFFPRRTRRFTCSRIAPVLVGVLRWTRLRRFHRHRGERPAFVVSRLCLARVARRSMVDENLRVICFNKSYFTISFEFFTQPFEVGIAPADGALFQTEDGEVCLPKKGIQSVMKRNCFVLSCEFHSRCSVYSQSREFQDWWFRFRGNLLEDHIDLRVKSKRKSKVNRRKIVFPRIITGREGSRATSRRLSVSIVAMKDYNRAFQWVRNKENK